MSITEGNAALASKIADNYALSKSAEVAIGIALQDAQNREHAKQRKQWQACIAKLRENQQEAHAAGAPLITGVLGSIIRAVEAYAPQH